MHEENPKAGPAPALRRLGGLFLPFLSAWAVFAYLHLVQCLFDYRLLPFLPWAAVFFLPVLPAEYYLTRSFSSLGRRGEKSGRRFPAAYIANVLFWLVFYLVWVAAVGYLSLFTPAFRLYGAYFFALTWALWSSMGWAALLGVAAWAAAYLTVTVRWGRLRLVCSIVPYFALTLLFFGSQWYYGGLGADPASDVAKQPGVVKVFDKDELQAALDRDPLLRRRVLRPPGREFETREEVRAVKNARGIWLSDSGDALFLTYGVTYVQQLTYPVLVRKDLRTGEIRYVLTDSNVRQAGHAGGDIFLAPWHDPFLYRLSARDLSVEQAVACQLALPPILWEPMSVIRDRASGRIIAVTEFYPALLQYDLATGRLLRARDLSAEGYMDESGTAWCPVQSQKTGKIYFILAPGRTDIIEVDPESLDITRGLDLGWAAGTALAMDEACETLYFQSGVAATLFAVDIASFTVKRTYKGAVHARRLAVDSGRNALYILDYGKGRLIAMDLGTGRRVWELRTGGRPHGLFVRDGFAWVHSMAGAFRVDLAAQWDKAAQKGRTP